MGSVTKVEKNEKALPVGRLMRFGFGIFFTAEVYDVYTEVSLGGALIRAGVAVGLLLSYLLLHFVISRYVSSLNRWLGAFLAFAPVVIVFLWGYGGPAATGALTFLGVSLVVAALRGDSGCEVMAIPAVFTGKHTHLACIFFSPIDWVEGKIFKNK